MMTAKVWRLGMGKVQLLAEQRHARAQLRKHVWIISLIFVFILFLISAYIYPRQSSSACYIFSSRGCKVLIDWLPLIPAREHTDKEIASHIVIKEILTIPLLETRNPKIAFMFLNPGSLHFERLWDRFFRARSFGGNFPWLMLRSSYWPMFFKILTIDIVSYFLIASTIPDHMEMADIPSTCYLKSRKRTSERVPSWNGVKRPCYLFARKIYPEALDNPLDLFSNYTTF